MIYMKDYVRLIGWKRVFFYATLECKVVTPQADQTTCSWLIIVDMTNKIYEGYELSSENCTVKASLLVL